MDPPPTLAAPATIGLALASWADLERLLSHATDELALVQPGPGRSSMAWTVAHLANHVDSWINVRFGGWPPDPLLSAERWRMGGDGSAESWPAIRDAAAAGRATARACLEGPGQHDLDRTIRYPGQMAALKGRNISLRYSLFRVIGHTYFHVGAMASDLVALGLSVGDYPGMMLEALDTDR